jgi:hypothetical protein
MSEKLPPHSNVEFWKGFKAGCDNQNVQFEAWLKMYTRSTEPGWREAYMELLRQWRVGGPLK